MCGCDIVDHTEAAIREKRYAQDRSIGSYIFKSAACAWTRPPRRPSKAAFLNHSVLKPNLRPKVLDFGHFVCVGLFALRDIEKGEELLYDYGDRSQITVECNPWLVRS
ncbi:[Histone H4]-lysine(20) N-methyltransferase [Aphelenchoides fujianensis]|nr:[Histone H4]-lysine(20) N-methyltransferase [Aphelenchoides fujianensis]